MSRLSRWRIAPGDPISRGRSPSTTRNAMAAPFPSAPIYGAVWVARDVRSDSCGVLDIVCAKALTTTDRRRGHRRDSGRGDSCAAPTDEVRRVSRRHDDDRGLSEPPTQFRLPNQSMPRVGHTVTDTSDELVAAKGVLVPALFVA